MAPTLRVVCISDTHNKHRDLAIPDGDLLVHAGDMSSHGDLGDIADFNRWLGTLAHRHKLVIAGNHDFCFERAEQREQARAALTNAEYLEDSSAIVDGLRVWGSPWQPWFHDWAFNLPRGAALRAKWDLIAGNTDILLTHGPPLGHGDTTFAGEAVGCDELLAAVRRVRPQLHVFGHIHEGYGVTHEGVTTLVNASACDLRYRPVNEPVVVDVHARE